MLDRKYRQTVQRIREVSQSVSRAATMSTVAGAVNSWICRRIKLIKLNIRLRLLHVRRDAVCRCLLVSF